MSEEVERRSPSQATIENTIAINKLTTISERTTADVDKLVKHIEKFLPMHERVQNMKTILYTGLSTAAVFGVWITIQYFTLSNQVHVYMAEDAIRDDEMRKQIIEKISDNKQQIQYVKGRINNVK